MKKDGNREIERIGEKVENGGRERKSRNRC